MSEKLSSGCHQWDRRGSGVPIEEGRDRMGGGVWKGGKDEKNAGAAACREAKKDTKERVRKDFFFFFLLSPSRLGRWEPRPFPHPEISANQVSGVGRYSRVLVARR